MVLWVGRARHNWSWKNMAEAQPMWGWGPEVRQEKEGSQAEQRASTICLNLYPQNSGKHLRNVKLGKNMIWFTFHYFKKVTLTAVGEWTRAGPKQRQGSDMGGSCGCPGEQRWSWPWDRRVTVKTEPGSWTWMRQELYPYFTKLQQKCSILFNCEYRQQTSATRAVPVTCKISDVFHPNYWCRDRKYHLCFSFLQIYGSYRPTTRSCYLRTFKEYICCHITNQIRVLVRFW